jgi:glycosyltransferase 2 family protein
MSRRTRTIVGVLLSLLLLGWALRDVSFSEVAHQIRTADYLLLTSSIIVALAGFHIRAYRWGILLLPVAPGIPFGPRLAAVYIGFAANNVLPARVGEFARALTLSKLSRIGPAPAFATLVVERLLDGIVLVGLLFIAMATPGFPAAGQVRAAATTAAVILTLVGAGLLLAVVSPSRARSLVDLVVRVLPGRLRGPVIRALRSFASGLAVLRSPRLFVFSVALAAGQWAFLALSFLLGFRAFGIDDVPFSGAIFLQSVIALSVAIPSSPGFFGPFEAAARMGLSLWGIPSDQAISFAIGYHIAGYLPVTLIGVYYVWKLNLTWSEVGRSEAAVESSGAAPQSIARREDR